MARKTPKQEPIKTKKPPTAPRKRHSNGPSMSRATGEHMLTPELMQQIVNYVKAGNYREVAAASAGISRATFFNWLSRGAHGEQPFADLLDAVEKADAQSEGRDVALIGKAAEAQWQAAAWRLERKNYKRWGRKDSHEITGDADRPVAVTVIKWGDEEIEF